MFYTDFADSRRSVYSWNDDMPNSLRAFTDEELVVYLGKTSDYKRINDTNPFLDFGVSSVPENEDGSTVSYADVVGLSIVKTSSDPKGCANVAQMLTQPDSLKELSGALKGVPPAKESVLNNPPQDPFYMPVFYKAAIRSLSWTDPDPANTDEVFSDMINSVVNEGAELDDAVDRAHNRFHGMISNL
ncbi:MAG: extracellular solute-binding protein [Patescibacteria group bacterium]